MLSPCLGASTASRPYSHHVGHRGCQNPKWTRLQAQPQLTTTLLLSLRAKVLAFLGPPTHCDAILSLA